MKLFTLAKICCVAVMSFTTLGVVDTAEAGRRHRRHACNPCGGYQHHHHVGYAQPAYQQPYYQQPAYQAPCNSCQPQASYGYDVAPSYAYQQPMMYQQTQYAVSQPCACQQQGYAATTTLTPQPMTGYQSQTWQGQQPTVYQQPGMYQQRQPTAHWDQPAVRQQSGFAARPNYDANQNVPPSPQQTERQSDRQDEQMDRDDAVRSDSNDASESTTSSDSNE